MFQHDEKFIQDIEDLENVIFVCFAKPRDEELPQTATDDAVVVDLMRRRTGESFDLLEAKLNNQIPQ